MRVLFPTGRLYDGVTSRIEKQLILHFHHAPADLRQCDDLTQRARESPQPRAGSLRRSTVAVDDYGFDLFRVHHTHGEIVIQPVEYLPCLVFPLLDGGDPEWHPENRVQVL